MTGKETAPDAGGWTFVAAAGTEVRWTLSGKAVLPQRARLPLRFEATSATATTLSRTRLQVLGWIEARVAQGRLETLRVPIPAGLKVVGVHGPIAGWNVEAGRLIVTPSAPVEGALAVEIELAGEPHDRFATPLLLPEGSARTVLLAKAALKGDGLLSLTDRGAAAAAGGARGGAPAGAAAIGAGPAVRRRRSRTGRRSGRRPGRSAREVLAAQVDRLLVDVAVGEAGKPPTSCGPRCATAARSAHPHLPAGFELAGGAPRRRAVVPGRHGGGSGSLAIPLLTQEAAQVVYLSGVIPLRAAAEGRHAPAPLPSLSAPVARVEVRLLVPGGRSYELAERARAGTVSPPPGTAPAAPSPGSGRRPTSQINSLAAPGRRRQAVARAGAVPAPRRFLRGAGRLERPLGRTLHPWPPRRGGEGEARMVLKDSHPSVGPPRPRAGVPPAGAPAAGAAAEAPRPGEVNLPLKDYLALVEKAEAMEKERARQGHPAPGAGRRGGVAAGAVVIDALAVRRRETAEATADLEVLVQGAAEGAGRPAGLRRAAEGGGPAGRRSAGGRNGAALTPERTEPGRASGSWSLPLRGGTAVRISGPVPLAGGGSAGSPWPRPRRRSR